MFGHRKTLGRMLEYHCQRMQCKHLQTLSELTLLTGGLHAHSRLCAARDTLAMQLFSCAPRGYRLPATPSSQAPILGVNPTKLIARLEDAPLADNGRAIAMRCGSWAKG